MSAYAAVMFAVAVAAEAAGLGGVPPVAVTLENMVFGVLLLASVVLALRDFIRRPRPYC